MVNFCKGCKFIDTCGEPNRKMPCLGYEIGNKKISKEASKVTSYCKGCKFFKVCGDPKRKQKCVGHEFGTKKGRK
jgi:hypothetical protein